VVSLRAGQQRSLDRIASTLLDDDLRLGSLFAIFTRLARDEAMPATERVMSGPWRRLRPALVAAAGLVTAASVLVLALLVPGRPACAGGAAAGPAHMQPFRAVKPAACWQSARAPGPASGLERR
jgi:hypothetical protein